MPQPREVPNPRRSPGRLALAMLAAGCLLTAHTASAGVGCISGPPHAGILGGALGSAPGGSFDDVACLEIREDAEVARSGEIAFSGVPLGEGLGLTDTDELVVVGPGDQRLAAQFDALSRWAGTADDPTRPIRWLQVAVPAELVADGVARYELRRYDAPPAPSDPYAASITFDDPTWRIETGLATFVLDPASGALLESIDIDLDDDGAGAKTRIYDHVAGAGPRLVFDPDENPGNGNDVTLDTSTAGQVVVDAGGFEVVEDGPVKVVVAARGHFIDGGGASVCTATTPNYESLGFTAVMTFVRGSRDVRLQFQVRNECSDAFGTDWTDDTLMVRQASWELPLALAHGAGEPTSYVGGDAPLAASAGGFTGVTEVEQRRGTGTAPDFTDWARRSRTRRGGVDLETAEAFTDPMVAVADATLVAAAQMPWMRFREPQALVVTDDDLSLRFVGEDLRLGEGKGLWNFARIHLLPTALATGGVSAALEALRARGRAELERGLLPWPGRSAINAARVVPSLGTGDAHTARTHTQSWIETLHAETIDPGGQWDRNKTFGSQLWPETGPNDPFAIDSDFPNQSTAGANYWDPAGVELLEFLASGDPRWAWDMAIPAYWVQAFLAFLNTGENFAGNRNGMAVESGGPGCLPTGSPPFVEPCTADGTGGGHWHRTGLGSDDYTYAMSMELGYALRPNLPLRDRFGQAGQTVIDRYDPSIPEADREAFVNAVNITRQVIQHFEMLANCAEFVPGARGQACQDRLHELVAELARDNLAAGVFCQGEVDFGMGLNGDIPGPPASPPSQCYSPQQFMTNALMYPFFHRYWSNYRHAQDADVLNTATAVRRALVEMPRALYTGGPGGPVPPLEQDGNGDLVPFGDWASILDCTMDPGGTTLVSCVTADDGGPLFMLNQNQPHTVALLLMAHDIDPAVGLCEVSRTAYDDPDLTGSPGDGGTFDVVGHFNQAGWWKGVAQMLQGVHFGLGIYDTCGPAAIFADGFESGDTTAWTTMVP